MHGCPVLLAASASGEERKGTKLLVVKIALGGNDENAYKHFTYQGRTTWKNREGLGPAQLCPYPSSCECLTALFGWPL